MVFENTNYLQGLPCLTVNTLFLFCMVVIIISIHFSILKQFEIKFKLKM